jgi:hypothetical protein
MDEEWNENAHYSGVWLLHKSKRLISNEKKSDLNWNEN